MAVTSQKKRHRLYDAFPYCVYCRKEMKFDDMTLDHIIPRSIEGGRKNNRIYNNLIPSCEFCNSKVKQNINPLIFIHNFSKEARFDIVVDLVSAMCLTDARGLIQKWEKS